MTATEYLEQLEAAALRTATFAAAAHDGDDTMEAAARQSRDDFDALMEKLIATAPKHESLAVLIAFCQPRAGEVANETIKKLQPLTDHYNARAQQIHKIGQRTWSGTLALDGYRAAVHRLQDAAAYWYDRQFSGINRHDEPHAVHQIAEQLFRVQLMLTTEAGQALTNLAEPDTPLATAIPNHANTWDSACLGLLHYCFNPETDSARGVMLLSAIVPMIAFSFDMWAHITAQHAPDANPQASTIAFEAWGIHQRLSETMGNLWPTTA